MTATRQDHEPKPDPYEDARIAYQVACELYMQENNVTWARFNAAATTNSVVVAAIGFTLDPSTRPLALMLFLPVFGFLLCTIWLRAMWRGFAYHDLWRNIAYGIERKASLGEVTEALLKADELSRNRSVILDMPGREPGEPDTMTIPSRQGNWFTGSPAEIPEGKAMGYAVGVIRLFMLLYVVAFFQVLYLALKCPQPAN